MARAGRWERAVLHGHVPEHPTPQAAGTEYFSLDDEDVPVAGSRPDRLYEVRPQERAQRRTVQQIVEFAPLPTLDDPAPQMVVQLPDVLLCFCFFRALSPDPEQVIEVPMIVPEDVSLRTVVREPQLVEQLVEVPTVVSWSMLQQIMEQNVDIPVVDRGGRSSGLQGFLPGQSSTALLSSGERISERTVEQIVDIPGGGLQDFRPGLSSSSVARSPAEWLTTEDEAIQVVFRTFPQNKESAKSGSHSSQRVPARLFWPIHAGSSAACSSHAVGHDHE